MLGFAGDRDLNSELRMCGNMYMLKGNEAINPTNFARSFSRLTHNADEEFGELACGFSGIYDNSAVFYDLRASHMQSLYLRAASRSRHNGCYG